MQQPLQTFRLLFLHMHALIFFYEPGVFLCEFLSFFRLLQDSLSESRRVGHLVNDPILIPALHHIIGDRSRNSEKQRGVVILLLSPHSVQTHAFIVDPDDGILIHTTDLPAGALSDDLIISRPDVPERFFHLEQPAETGHVQNVIDLGRNIDDIDLRLLLPELQQGTEACA